MKVSKCVNMQIGNVQIKKSEKTNRLEGKGLFFSFYDDHNFTFYRFLPEVIMHFK